MAVYADARDTPQLVLGAGGHAGERHGRLQERALLPLIDLAGILPGEG